MQIASQSAAQRTERSQYWRYPWQSHGLAERETQREVHDHVEAEHPENRVAHRGDAARRRVVGRSGPTHHLRGERGVHLDHVYQLVHAGIRVCTELEDALRDLRHRREIGGVLDAFAKAPCREACPAIPTLPGVRVESEAARRSPCLRHQRAEGRCIATEPYARRARGQQHFLLTCQRTVDHGGNAERTGDGGGFAAAAGESGEGRRIPWQCFEFAAREAGECSEVQQLVSLEQCDEAALGIPQQHCAHLCQARDGGVPIAR